MNEVEKYNKSDGEANIAISEKLAKELKCVWRS